ncbi:MAG: hypothetical protein ACU0CA_11760 [Paracoccaceae bacterium]
MGTEAALRDLKELLDTARLPDQALKSGTRLLERIGAPVRIILLGLPGSGKSELLNFLAGTRIVPPNTKFPTLELIFGQNSRTTLTGQDGATTDHSGIAVDQIKKSKPVFVKIETNLPILKNTSFLEVVTGASPKDQAAAIDWAVRRADMVIWCSQGFSEVEQTLWSRVPDNLKDHSFFVLNRADTLTAEGLFADRIAALQTIVADEFYSLIPIATLRAIAASQNPDGPDEALLKDSGGKALLSAISKQVNMGRRADADSVLMFLNRYKTHAKPASKSPVETAKPILAKQHTSEQSPAVDPGNSKDINSAALAFLHENTTELSAAASLGSEEILSRCCDISNHLADMFADTQSVDADLQDDILDAAEVLVLMQLEEGDAPAADAVTLLLQLKRGFELKIAA